MSCQEEYAAWQAAEQEMQAAVAARASKRDAEAAAIAAAEAATKDREAAESTASDAIQASGVAYNAYIQCLANS